LEQQHGENEVKLAEIRGHIEQEKLTGELVSVKNSYIRKESSQTGESQGARISNFMEALPGELSTQQKMDIYLDTQNTDRVKEVSHIQGLKLYLTPKDLDIKMINIDYKGGDNNIPNAPILLN
jgi:hypothetical protein